MTANHMEFGGPPGVVAMMIGFPLLMYYLWLSVEFNQGKLLKPKSFDDFHVWFDLIKQYASPTKEAFEIYTGILLIQVIFALIMPGPTIQGLPVPSLKGKRLEYHCNAVASWWSLLALTFVLHWTGVFPLQNIIMNFGSLMTVAMIYGFAITFLVYFVTVYFGNGGEDMTGNFFYDLFMGAALNPRIGPLDIKLWAELRLPWPLLFLLTLSACVKQYQDFGFVSGPLLFILLGQWLYANACAKGEECVVTTWDILSEKFGFMLCFWNMAGVPFTYCLSMLYAFNYSKYHGHPLVWPSWYMPTLTLVLLITYYVWDTANSQKNRFRQMQAGTYVERWAFPQLPWGTLPKDAKHIKTKQGNLLLTDGWWAYGRKLTYTADLIMALCWGLAVGFGSFIPYFYPFFFCIVLVHRVGRDMERCAQKYGDDWKAYCRQVPWIFVPGVY